MKSKHSRRKVGSGAVALALCLGLGTAAQAEEPAALFENGADLLAQAGQLWAEGTRELKRGQLEHARLLYLSAWRAQHHWQIAGSLGHTELALGKHRDAAEHLAVYLRETRDLPNADPQDRAVLSRELEIARSKIGVVTVTVEPQGAEVYVDGALAGKAPLSDPVFVDPGRHVVEARLEGYTPATEARDLAPGTGVDMALKLVAVPAPKAQVAEPPLVPRREPIPMPVGSRLNKGVVIGGAALSAVALGVGIGLAAVSGSAASERDGFRAGCRGGDAGSCSQFDSNDQRRWATGNAAAYTFIGAGVVAIATTTYALVASRPKQPAKVTTSAKPGVTGSGFAFAW